MDLNFAFVREIDVSGGAPSEANPNVTTPGAGFVFTVPERVGQEYTNGASVYIRAVDGTDAEVPADTANFTLWCRDEGATVTKPGPGGKSRWVKAIAESLAPSSGIYTGRFIGKIYIQVTGAAISTSTKLQIFCCGRKL